MPNPHEKPRDLTLPKAERAENSPPPAGPHRAASSGPARAPIQPATPARPAPKPVPTPTERAAAISPARRAPETIPDTERPRRGAELAGAAALDVGGGFAKYSVGAEIGRGAFGMVRRVADRSLQRELALKVLLDPHDPNAVAEFVEEAQITGQLEHPNIVPIYDLGRDAQARPYIAMKLVRGRTLQQIIDAHKAAGHRSTLADLQRDGRLEIFLKVCDAIAYAHSRGVVHRDLKPDNIMVGEFGEVHVMDWGLAKILDAGPIPATLRSRPGSEIGGSGASSTANVRSDRRAGGAMLTMQGDVFGTPAFMPPEQAAGDVAAMDARSDIFALGGILYALLCFEHPYGGRELEKVLHAARNCQFSPPRKRYTPAGIPRELDAIVMKAMAKKPAKRYAAVADLKADIAAFLAHDRVSAWRDGFAGRVAKWARRHPTMAMSAVVLLMATCIVGAIATVAVGAVQQAEMVAARERAESDMREARAAEEIAKRDADRVRAEQAAHAAHLKALAEAEKFDELREMVGAQLKRKRDQIRQEFLDGWKQRPPGTPASQYIEWLGSARAEYYISAFERVIQGSEAAEQGFLEADDFAMLAVLVWTARGDREAAERWFSKAIEIAAEQFLPDLLSQRGAVRGELGRRDEALADFERALGIEPRHIQTRIQRGSFLMNSGDWQAGERDFDFLIREYPNRSFGYENRAWLRLRLRRLDEALADFNQALALAPNHPGLLRGRGRAKEKSQDLPGAIDDFTRAIELAPTYGVAFFDRADVWAAMGQTDRAMADYAQAVDLSPILYQAWHRLGRIRMQRGDGAGAMRDFEGALTANPQYWLAWAELGMLRVRVGQTAAGVEALQNAYRFCDRATEKQQLAGLIRQHGGTVPE